MQATIAEWGRIDCVFNCAGVNPTAVPIEDTSDEYFDRLVNTNLRGPFNITRAVVPHLESGAAIVNVASTAGLRASRGYSIVRVAGVSSCILSPLMVNGGRVILQAAESNPGSRTTRNGDR